MRGPQQDPAELAKALSSAPRDVITIIDGVAGLRMSFLTRQIAGDPAGEIRKTRRLTRADLDSEPVRRARVRSWVAEGYIRLLIAHELYPDRFPHPGPFDTPEWLAKVDEMYAQHFRRRPDTFAARMAGY